MKKYAIIVAGGQGLRLGERIPKQFLPINGRPLLFYTLEKFHGIADEIILVLPSSHIEFWDQLCLAEKFDSRAKVVEGGNNRTLSVMNGLAALHGMGNVAIHDAVRPLVSKDLIQKLFDETAVFGNAIPATPVRESMRYRDNDVNKAVNRNDYVAVQTPQCFDFQKITHAYQLLGNMEFTDDASVFEFAGGVIHLVEGETSNIKITYPEDVSIAEALLKVPKV